MKLLLCFLFVSNVFATIILIDPGHGGEDKGAKNSFSKNKKKYRIEEKDITLQIGKYLKSYLEKDYSVFLTRSLDSTVTLEKRAEIAEKINADLFISIHVNASTNRRASGFETYYLDNHDDVAVKKVEGVENRNLKGDALIINKILTDLVIDRTVDTSKALASSVHTYLGKRIQKKYKMNDRGLKPGLFYVLALSKRPGILLEIGFLSNSKEALKISDPSFQKAYAKGAAEGIKKYLSKKSGPSFF